MKTVLLCAVPSPTLHLILFALANECHSLNFQPLGVGQKMRRIFYSILPRNVAKRCTLTKAMTVKYTTIVQQSLPQIYPHHIQRDSRIYSHIQWTCQMTPLSLLANMQSGTFLLNLSKQHAATALSIQLGGMILV